MQSQVLRLQEIICTLTSEIRSLREEVSKQSDYTKRHNKHSYGKKSLFSRTKQDVMKSCEEDKMDDDGSGPASIVSADSSLDSTKVKSENLDKERGPRGPYTVMEAAKVIHLKTILDGCPVGMKFIGYKTIEEFNRWLLHTPNHRENMLMRIDKFTSCESIRLTWLKRGARYLNPLCDYIKEKLLKVKSILPIDETWCRVRIQYKGDGTKLGKY